MARNEPEVLSVWEFMARFSTDDVVRKHLEQVRWGDSPICPKCGSRRSSVVQSEKPAPYRCKDCRKYFSVTTGTVFHSSNLSPRKCLYAMYLLTVAKTSISSCQLARELEVTQKTAWYLAQRIRQTWLSLTPVTGGTSGEVGSNEAYFGGKERNKHRPKRLNAGRGAVRKPADFRMRERKSGRVFARPIIGTGVIYIRSEVRSEVRQGDNVSIDGHGACRGLHEYRHEVVGHPVGEYVRWQAVLGAPKASLRRHVSSPVQEAPWSLSR